MRLQSLLGVNWMKYTINPTTLEPLPKGSRASYKLPLIVEIIIVPQFLFLGVTISLLV
ncbi:MAG TPA: hypothetical protein VIH79_00745 [Candidatus Nanopelagicaceae bacterium]